MTHKELFERAQILLRANDRGRYTIPSARLYPHQWAWDSAFASLGWLHIDPDRALLELTSLFEGQWEDGRIPHIQFHIRSKEYFPGPDAWHADRTSTISNPPIWTLALRRLFKKGHHREAIAQMLPAVERSHLFFHQQRDPLGWGVICTAHPWENGLDNCPAWDRELAAIDPARAPDFKRVDKDRVEDASQRPTDDQYRRYMALVEAIAANDYGMGDFAVYDPFLTTLLALAEEALAEMAEAVGWETQAAQRAQGLRQGLADRLWDQDNGRYRFYSVNTQHWDSPDLLPAHAPVMLGPSQRGFEEMKRALLTRYWTAHPLPTCSPTSPHFEPQRYWRGPAWVNMAWLYAPALGDALVNKTLDHLEDKGFWEYFDPHSGDGLGASDFTWSAALAMDMIATREEL